MTKTVSNTKERKINIGGGKREYIDIKKVSKPNHSNYPNQSQQHNILRASIDTMKAQLKDIKAVFEEALKDVPSSKPEDSETRIHNQVRELLSKRKR